MNEINITLIKNIEATPMSDRKEYEKAGRTRKGATPRTEGDGAIYVKNEIPFHGYCSCIIADWV